MPEILKTISLKHTVTLTENVVITTKDLNKQFLVFLFKTARFLQKPMYKHHRVGTIKSTIVL